jgi:predicted RNase H-like HicB family nuclease
MENLKYTMLIQWSEEDQLYLVHFPDFPQQHFLTHGKSYPEAASNGQDALSGLIVVLRDQNRPIPVNDEILPEYDFSQGIRGKHAHRVGKPYTVTIHNGDGTATVQQFDGAGNMISERKNVPIGDS